MFGLICLFFKYCDVKKKKQTNSGPMLFNVQTVDATDDGDLFPREYYKPST